MKDKAIKLLDGDRMTAIATVRGMHSSCRSSRCCLSGC